MAAVSPITPAPKAHKSINNSSVCCFCDKPVPADQIDKLCADHSWARHRKINGLPCPYVLHSGKTCGRPMTVGALSRGYYTCCLHTTELASATTDKGRYLRNQLQSLAILRSATGLLTDVKPNSKRPIAITSSGLPQQVVDRHQAALAVEQEHNRLVKASKAININLTWLNSDS